MRLSNIKTIKNKHYLERKSLYPLLALTDIQEVEYWEEWLDRTGVPYATVQAETTLTNPSRYKRGYALLCPIGAPKKAGLTSQEKS